MGFLLFSPFSYLFLTSFFLKSTDISINTTVWTIKDGQLALTSSLPLLPSQCLLQHLMVRDHVRMNTCARGCVCISKSYQCSPSLSSETFLSVFPAQDRQAVWPTQLDTRYILPGLCERPKTWWVCYWQKHSIQTLELLIAVGQGSRVDWNVLLA